MQLIFFLYLPGHAGHFLSRLFSLGNDTIPQLPKKILSQVLDTGEIPEVNRIEMYRFSEVLQNYLNWQNFHRAWTDYYTDHHLYHWLFVGSYKDSKLICPLHPHEFMLRQLEIDSETKPKRFFYVHLSEKYHDWVARSQSRLKFVLRPNETQRYHELIEKYSMSMIDLGKMLESVPEFLQEYHRICNELEIASVTDQALELYQDWRSARYD